MECCDYRITEDSPVSTEFREEDFVTALTTFSKVVSQLLSHQSGSFR